MKILIIDDSLMDRKLLSNVLKKNGVTNDILEASDGEEGLITLSDNHDDICLILLDWQMPKMNGIEFMEGVVKVEKVASIPIFMITASGSEDSRRTAYAANPKLAGYIVKPYKPEKLIEMIKPFLK